MGLLEKKDAGLVKEVARTLCNVSNSDPGKKLLCQCNALPHLNKLLQGDSEPAVKRFAVACLANIATAVELKAQLGERSCLIHVLNTLQSATIEADPELVRYCLYFVGNLCEDYPESAYVLGTILSSILDIGKLMIMQTLARLLNSKIGEEMLADVLDVMYVLVKIKENLYPFPAQRS